MFDADRSEMELLGISSRYAWAVLPDMYTDLSAEIQNFGWGKKKICPDSCRNTEETRILWIWGENGKINPFFTWKSYVNYRIFVMELHKIREK